MKKLVMISCLMIVYLLTGCENSDTTTTSKHISDSIGIKLPTNAKIEYNDSHGGLHGDGLFYAKVKFINNEEEDLIKDILSTKGWNNTPIDETLSLMLYGGEKDGISYGYNLAEQAGIPKVSSGYWKFIDRYDGAVNSSDTSELMNRNSFNFTVAIFDEDTNVLYFFEFDT